MKVLLLHNRYQHRGGEDVVFDRERQLLIDAGVTVDTLLWHSDQIQSPLAKAKVAFGVAYSESGKQETIAKIKSFRPDLVHVHNTFPRPSRSVWDAAREMGLPVVQTLHNYRLFCANALLLRNGEPCTLCLDQNPWRSVRYGCYRESSLASIPVAHMIDRQLQERAWEKVDRFVCVTDFAKTLFSQLGIPEEKLAVKTNFSPDLREVLGEGATDSGQGVVCFGRLSEEKGLRTLATAWQSRPFPLRVLGEGPLAPVLEGAGLPPESGLPQIDCWKIMAKARCLVAPTECYEGGFLLVVQEALSLGLPVITTQIGANNDYLRDGHSALLVPPRDPAALSAAVHRLLADDELWVKLSRGARQTYEERFTAKKSSENLLKIYSSVLDPGKH